tara:strand:+ start:153 stop:386 length:234 start_codon:yes stop_codon:yes gene_type:complete
MTYKELLDQLRNIEQELEGDKRLNQDIIIHLSETDEFYPILCMCIIGDDQYSPTVQESDIVLVSPKWRGEIRWPRMP